MSTTADEGGPPTLFRARVRDVAEFCCRRGDLSTGIQGVRAEQGQEAQRQIQRSVPDGYRREVPVSRECQRGAVRLLLAGRIDGLWMDSDIPVIDEIKATLHTPDSLPAGVHAVHLAQAMMYAAMESTTATAPRVRVRVIYRRIDTDEDFQREETIDHHDLTAWFAGVTDTYLDWLDLILAHRQRRDGFLGDLAFPWPEYRPGQRALMTHVWRTIKSGQVALVQAATGSGKTLSMLFPALKALGDGSISQIRFLTAKTTGQRSVMQALDLLEPSAWLLSLFPGARERLCPCLSSGAAKGGASVGTADGPLFAALNTPCERQTGYFDRLPAARRDALATLRLDDQGLQRVAERHRICPHALALDMAAWADLVTGDYNYQFDPGARLPVVAESSTLLLVDEAHNLAERARRMYSTVLSRAMTSTLLRHSPPRRIRTALRALEAIMVEGDGSGRPLVHPSPPDALKTLLTDLSDPLRQWLDQHRDSLPAEAEIVWYSLRGLRRALDEWGPSWRFVLRDEGPQASMEAWCIDPGPYLAADFAASGAALAFSGTLAPRDLHAFTLGLERLPAERRGRDLSVPHSLRDTRLQAFVLAWPMNYRQRDASLPRFVSLMELLLTHRPGRWLLSSPGYQMLRDLQALLGEQIQGHPLLAQEDTASGQDRAEWLHRFSGTDRVLGCVVSGGRFAEGLDLADTPVTGVVMAGLPVPPPTPERQALAHLLDDAGLEGQDLAWTQPAVEKTLQTAGRLLRRDGDRGIVVLVDARYTQSQVRRRLPAHWEVTDLTAENALAGLLSSAEVPS